MIKLYYKPKLRNSHTINAKRFYFKNQKEDVIFRGAAILLTLAILLVVADIRMRPIIKEVGGSALKNTLANVLDGAVNDMVDELGVNYNDMVNIEKNPDGSVSAVTFNTTYINGYKADLSDGCSDKLSNFDETEVPIPIGSLLGGSFFNGRGFRFNLKATIYGFAVTDVESKFESAGINQTRHTIYLNVQASAHSYMGLCHLNESVDETVILVETIIVGKVPDTYYVRGQETSENEFGK